MLLVSQCHLIVTTTPARSPLIRADKIQKGTHITAMESVIRLPADRTGETLTTHLRAIARENPDPEGIIDRVDFNATTHGQRDIDDDRLSSLIEKT